MSEAIIPASAFVSVIVTVKLLCLSNLSHHQRPVLLTLTCRTPAERQNIFAFTDYWRRQNSGMFSVTALPEVQLVLISLTEVAQQY
jgi:hypothetical protein